MRFIKLDAKFEGFFDSSCRSQMGNERSQLLIEKLHFLSEQPSIKKPS